MNTRSTFAAAAALACALAMAQTDSQTKPLACPVLGEPVPTGALSVDYRGLKVSFCCGGCDSKFLKEPEKFLAASAESGDAIAVSLFDPVSQTRLDLEQAKASIDFQGIRYPFQSQENLDEFLALPGSYILAPNRESLTCPVMKKASASHSQAAGYADFKGVRYYFCCAGCEESFDTDPDKYSALVADKVKIVSAQGAAKSSHLTMAPTCAGCAGEARLLNNGGFAGKFTLGYRFVAIDEIAARHRFTLDYAATPRLIVGIERSGSDSNPIPVPRFHDSPSDFLRNSDGDALILPRFSWFVTPEGPTHPSFLVGMASDRLSTPRGAAFFATASKHIPGTPVTPFISVKANSYDGRTVMPFGINYALPQNFVFQAINDGDYTHLLITKMFDRASVSLLFARTRYIGFSVAVGF